MGQFQRAGWLGRSMVAAAAALVAVTAAPAVAGAAGGLTAVPSTASAAQSARPLVTRATAASFTGAERLPSGLRRASSTGKPGSRPLWVVPPPRTSLRQSTAATASTGALSENWAGYALDNGTFTEADTQWVVPTVTQTAADTYSSTWLGVDGLTNQNLIQTGTEQDWVGGAAQYSAWYEILPAPAIVLNEPVHPGDQMQAQVTEQAPGSWVISLADMTGNWLYENTFSYSGPGASAEYITERPSTCLGPCLLPLAKFGAVNFSAAHATVTTPSSNVTTFQINMVDDGGAVIAQPSNMDLQNNFTVTRLHPPLPWLPLPGAALDISAGANDSLWVIGTNPVTGGHGIYTLTGSGWKSIGGGAVRIAVDPNGLPWIVNSSHQIYHYNGSSWKLVLGPGGVGAVDISAGANGAVWLIGGNPVTGGYGIYTFTGSGWKLIPGGGVALGVGPDGLPWIVNSSHQIYHYNGSSWRLVPGPVGFGAIDISVGADGSAWIVSTKPVTGGYAIYTWNVTAWAGVPGGAVRIAVAPDGSPAVINASLLIYSA